LKDDIVSLIGLTFPSLGSESFSTAISATEPYCLCSNERDFKSSEYSGNFCSSKNSGISSLNLFGRESFLLKNFTPISVGLENLFEGGW